MDGTRVWQAFARGECPNEQTAAHREEMLIAVLAPKFNRAGKVWPLIH